MTIYLEHYPGKPYTAYAFVPKKNYDPVFSGSTVLPGQTAAVPLVIISYPTLQGVMLGTSSAYNYVFPSQITNSGVIVSFVGPHCKPCLTTLPTDPCLTRLIK